MTFNPDLKLYHASRNKLEQYIIGLIQENVEHHCMVETLGDLKFIKQGIYFSNEINKEIRETPYENLQINLFSIDTNQNENFYVCAKNPVDALSEICKEEINNYMIESLKNPIILQSSIEFILNKPIHNYDMSSIKIH
jgi:hypothetical protein